MLVPNRTDVLEENRRQKAEGNDMNSTNHGWHCRTEPNPPGELLILTWHGPEVATGVRVLLDGRPARDQPTVYMAPDVPDVVTPGTELRYPYVLTGGAAQFHDIEVHWTDRHGRPQVFTTTYAQCVLTG